MSAPRRSRWLAWQGVGLAVVWLAPSLGWLHRPPWAASADQSFQIAVVLAAYAAAVVGILLLSLGRGGIRLPMAAGVLGSCLAAGLLALLLEQREYYRTVLLAGTGLSAFFVLFPLVVARLGRWTTPVSISVLVLAVSGTGMLSLKDPPLPGPRSVVTNEYVLEADFHEGVTEHAIMGGGGVAALGEAMLVSNGLGVLYHTRLGPDRDLVMERLEIPPPDFGEFTPDTPPELALRRMRVNDVEVIPVAEGAVLLVSHFYWDRTRYCRTVHLSAMELRDAESVQPITGEWRVLHEATPCARFGRGGDPWNFLMTGGRILPLGDGRILFTVGNPTHPMLSQDPESDLGRTLVVDVRTGASEVFSIGHRNAQGLARDGLGRIWSTEHGPKGGDELNLLIQGGNYGWPVRTHGVEYVTSYYPDYGEIDLGVVPVEPVHSWVPSIGISNLIVLDSDRFPSWRGDLLIASLRGRSLFRVRIRDGKVAFVEPIPIGLRIRDLLQAPDGRVVLWTDQETLVVLDAPNVSGSAELLTDCFACHTWTGEEPMGTAPPLQGVYGRRIASVEGYTYSDALDAMRGEWTAELLNQYLKDPAGAVPGTLMQLPGIAEESVRAGIIRYLQENR